MARCHQVHVDGPLYPDGRPERVIALLGNPNVGKSTIFNHLTGADVLTAHYPGKSADVHVGTTEVFGRLVDVIDLPGTYGIHGDGAAERTSRRALLDTQPDAAVVVLDATNLQRNLVLALEVLDLGIPVVLALNLVDEAGRAGVRIDEAALAAAMGARVVPTVAVAGTGVLAMMEAAIEVAHEPRPLPTPLHRYGQRLEAVVGPLARAVEVRDACVSGLTVRPLALELLRGSDDVIDTLHAAGEGGLVRVAGEARASFEHVAGAPAGAAISHEHHILAARIAKEVSSAEEDAARRVRWERIATSPLTGVPMLAGVLGAIFLLLFFIGEFLAGLFSTLWARFASPVIQSAVRAVTGEGVVGDTLLWGFDAGIEAALSIGLPYILTFYVLLGILEDSGYLNAVAFLSDRVMHRFGLHGRAIIPLVAGAGCSVPAVLSTRVLSTDRERFIASTLVSFVPCSARTAVILGAVGHYIGIGPALGVYAVTAAVTVGVGVAMGRLVPGQARGLVMEMFPFRTPNVRVVARKAWSQFMEFIVVVTPVVVVGSILLGGLYESGWIWTLTTPLDPVIVGLLGLPSVAGLTLLFGLLRKEFALQLLATLAIATMGEGARDLSTFMSSTDLFVYALVNTLAIPCISTVVVLAAVLGKKRAAFVVSITIGVALAAGAVFARLIPFVAGA